MPAPSSRPRLSARPLLDTDADAPLFVPIGTALTELLAATARGYSVLLHGRRGSGRTTLLRALQRSRRLADTPETPGATVFVQAARATTAGEALLACLRALDDVTADDFEPSPAAERHAPADATSALAALRRATSERHVTFLVDNLDPHVAHRLFGLGRDDLWEVDASFVVTATDDDLAIVLAPPADAFFEVRVALSPPTRAEAEDLLERRLGHEVDLSGTTAATPRELLDAARADPHDPASADAARQRRLEAAATLGAPALGVAHLLDELGPISPSDETVRNRLGLTAARVSQILVQMYDEGLVVYDDVRQGGPGRPRRRYRWAGGAAGDDVGRDEPDAASTDEHAGEHPDDHTHQHADHERRAP
ncbi:ATP-binding protein [Mobilicoccus massiliensis]|uniref:ATP-binding protein n=1 Tax=Mobilicoccus massiliensis TaxID=1522310 RepID=UPI000694A311|nr:ATP-binding protein [Mobilicoccus massiliensis]